MFNLLTFLCCISQGRIFSRVNIDHGPGRKTFRNKIFILPYVSCYKFVNLLFIYYTCLWYKLLEYYDRSKLFVHSQDKRPFERQEENSYGYGKRFYAKPLLKCLYTSQIETSSPHHDRFRDRKLLDLFFYLYMCVYAVP